MALVELTLLVTVFYTANNPFCLFFEENDDITSVWIDAASQEKGHLMTHDKVYTVCIYVANNGQLIISV